MCAVSAANATYGATASDLLLSDTAPAFYTEETAIRAGGFAPVATYDLFPPFTSPLTTHHRRDGTDVCDRLTGRRGQRKESRRR